MQGFLNLDEILLYIFEMLAEDARKPFQASWSVGGQRVGQPSLAAQQ